jgi:hypothetical protein
VVTSLGIRWLCVCLLVQVPWSQRAWALPFLAVPLLSEKTANKLKKTHRSSVWWTGFLVKKIRTWYPHSQITLTGDGGFASVCLVAEAQAQKVAFVSRLRLDAQWHDFPGPQPANKRGPKPRKGARQTNLQQRLLDPATKWQQMTLAW